MKHDINASPQNGVDLRTAANVAGAIFVLIGIMGFIPRLAPDEMLLGIFHVNTFHNIVHIGSGLVAFYAASRGHDASVTYFRGFGWVYGLVALLGIFEGPGMLFGVMANNIPDVLLHFAIAAVSLGLGYSAQHTHAGRPGRVGPVAPRA